MGSNLPKRHARPGLDPGNVAGIHVFLLTFSGGLCSATPSYRLRRGDAAPGAPPWHVPRGFAGTQLGLYLLFSSGVVANL